MISDMPSELLFKIFGYLDPETAQIFACVSKQCNSITKSNFGRAQLIANYYGTVQAFYFGYLHHRSMLDGNLASVLYNQKCVLPRFVAQLVIRDYQTKSIRQPHTSFYVFVVNQAYLAYGDDVDFKGNDTNYFETLLRSPDVDKNIASLKQLMCKYYFFPVIDHSRQLIGESLFILATLDLSLINDLVRSTGFDLNVYNDAVMELLLDRPVSKYIVQKFISAGFNLSDFVIKKAIASGKPYCFTLLFALTERERLFKLAEDSIYELFGPYLDRHTSLNIPWDSQAIHRIVQTFNISDVIIEKALLDKPENCCSFEKVHDNFPVTRPYLKARPYSVWKWILDTYGPHHRYTLACFDDALSRASSDASLHQLIESYLISGVVLRPRHVKIIACRILHRNMTENALKVMIHLRKQIAERRRSQKDLNSDDHISHIKEDELLAFYKALDCDVLNNDDWKQKSSSIQLGGGSNGGTYRIHKTPGDVVKFINECSKLAADIEYWTCSVPMSDGEESMDRKPRSTSSVSIYKKMKLYG